MEGSNLKRESASNEQKTELFYHTLFRQGSDQLSPEIVTYMLLCISMLLLFIPVQELLPLLENDNILVIWAFNLLTVMAVTFYMKKYHVIACNKQMETIADCILYMPVDKKAYKKYIFKQLLQFLKKISIAGVIQQLSVALIAYHTISFWNILYVLVQTFLIPVVFCSYPILFRKSTKS